MFAARSTMLHREMSYRRPRVSQRRHPGYDERVPRPRSLQTPPFRVRPSDKPLTETQAFAVGSHHDEVMPPSLHCTVFIPQPCDVAPTAPLEFNFRTNSPRGMERERIRRYPAPWKPHKSDKELTVPEPFGLYGTEHAVEVPVPKVLRRRPFTPVPCGTALTSTRPFPFETAYDPAPMMMGQM